VDLRERLCAALVCPRCHGSLGAAEGGLVCPACRVTYPMDDCGFADLGADAGGARERSARLEAYAGHQEASAERRYRDYLLPWASSEPVTRLLDAGCGVGATTTLFVEDGFDAYGVDLPKAATFWARLGRDPGRFFFADVAALPFADGWLDAVVSLAVIEHVGTVTGHCTLAPGYRAARAAYARELLRVTRPGGRVLVTCPNKSFPLDFHHGLDDEAGRSSRLRAAIARKTGLNVHSTWGRYHLLSFSEIRELFVRAGARQVVRLPAKHYFAFEGVARGWPGASTALVRKYVEGLPVILRGTPLDPFLLVEVRR
jgi:SAM-dependent methyltransferase